MMQMPATNSIVRSPSPPSTCAEDLLSTQDSPTFYESTNAIEDTPVVRLRSSRGDESGDDVRQTADSPASIPSLFERCKGYIRQSAHAHLLNLIADLQDSTVDIHSLLEGQDWGTINSFLTPVNVQTEIDGYPFDEWRHNVFRTALLGIFSSWPQQRQAIFEDRLRVFMSCLDEQTAKAASLLFEPMQEALKQVDWLHLPSQMPSTEFTPSLGERPGGSAPEMQYFLDSAGNRWLGKCGSLALYNRDILLWENRDKTDFISPYADEVLEKLGLAIYELVGVKVPQSVLSYQWVTEEVKEEFECDSPRMHYLSRWIDNFHTLGPHFVADYLKKAKKCGNNYVKIKTQDGQELPLKGLGAMLAVADFLYDLDCIGNQGGNAGYVIAKDKQTGKPYAQLVKIDAGYAFSYYSARYDQGHDPRKRNIRIRPDEGMLEFANLAPADRKEFAVTAKRMLNIPRETYRQLFLRAEEIEEGIPKRHSQAMLDGLIARKNLFLKAFAGETDRAIVEEIEAAQITTAKKLEAPEEMSGEIVEELLTQEKEESKALAEMRVRLAVLDAEQSEPKKLGECKTFQLPTTTTHFIGRKEALAEVAKQLSQQHGSVVGQSISGIGGVGKTQLALHYAQAAVSGKAIDGEYLSYDYVVWLNAEVYLEGQFQAMAELWTGAQLKAEAAIEAVYRYLRDKRTLLVFDNAENARSIAAFLPPAHYTSPVHFLITSRSAQWGEIPTVSLGSFSLEEAQEYVEYHLGPQPKEAVKKLVELLGGLPLAMSQAVFYMKAGHSTLEGFEEQFHLNQASLLSHELLEEEDHPKTVGTTLTLCLAQAKVKSPLVERLLGTVAYFAAEGIKEELVQEGLEVSKEEIAKALEVLESYSLVGRGAGELQVHRLVQEVMRHRHKFLKEPHRYWNKVVELLNKVIFYDETNIEGMKQCSHAIVHVKRVGELSKKASLSQEEELKLADLLEVSGLHQQTMGNYEVARELQSQVLEIRETHYGREHVKVAKTLMNLGSAYGALGDACKQKDLLERALRIKEAHYGPEDVEVADVLTNLGTAYGALGDANKRKELLKRARSIYKKHYGYNHPHMATILTSLGGAYGALGDVNKQKELLKQALNIQQQYYGRFHPQTAITLFNLSRACFVSDEILEAKKHAETACSIFRDVFNDQHPDVQKARDIVNMCEEKMKVSTFAITVACWVEFMKSEMRKMNFDHDEDSKAAILVSKALRALTEDSWDNLLMSPEDYGISRQEAEALNEFIKSNPILLEARNRRELAERLYSNLMPDIQEKRT